MLTIAARVPDHGKLVPWRFIVLAGDARKRAGETVGALYAAKNADADQAKVDEECNRFAQAPLVVIVVSTAAPHVKIPEWEQVLSAGNAAMNLELAAHALGYASQWTTGFPAYDPDAAPRARPERRGAHRRHRPYRDADGPPGRAPTAGFDHDRHGVDAAQILRPRAVRMVNGTLRTCRQYPFG